MNQLVNASEVDPDRGFMARTMALCSLPRSNPGNRTQYKRVNGPYTLIMSATGVHKLPYGNLPRLILAWICTESVRTQNRELVLGKSLAGFMRSLGVYSTNGGKYTRLRNQMKRLFGCSVSMTYEDKHGEQFVSSLIAERGEFWWNVRKPDVPVLWESKIELSEKFFNEIIRHPVPLDMNTLAALKRSPLGLDLYLWLTYRTFALRAPQWLTWKQLYQAVRSTPGQVKRQGDRSSLPPESSARIEEDQGGLAGPELHHSSGSPDPASLNTGHRATQSSPAKPLVSPFPASQRPVSGLSPPG